jgi:hypothetical protein
MAMTIEMLNERIEALEKQLALVLNNEKPEKPEKDIKEKKVKKTKKSEKSEKSDDSDDDKPKKKRANGYILYSNAHRDDVKTRLSEESDEKPKNTDIMKELAKMWKELGDEEKEAWTAKAKEAAEQA